MFVRVAALAALLVSMVSPAFALQRQPTGQWVVNFDAAQCFAARNFGSVEKPLYLVLKAPPLGDVMQIAVMRKGSRVRAEQQRGSIQFDNRESIRISMLDYWQTDARLRTFLANVPLGKFAPARQSSSVRITTPGLDERLVLSSMASLLKAMDDCVTDLRRVWNVKAGESSPPMVKESAKGDLLGLFDSDDYPTQAILEGSTGKVAIVILIDELGKVADCTIIETSGVPVLDAQACAVIRERARFTPAVGLDGKPAKSAYRQRITWKMR